MSNEDDQRDRAGTATALPDDFIETIYLATNPDVGEAVANGVWPSGAAHWLERGWRENRPTLSHEPGLATGSPPDRRQPGPETAQFDAVGYLHLYPDLTRALGADLAAARDHWLAFGRLEGRLSPGAMPHARRLPSIEALLALPFGLDVYAAFDDRGARGAQARHLVRVLIEAGVSTTARGFDLGRPQPRIARGEQQTSPGHRASLILAEPSELSALASLYPAGHFGGSYVIAAWSAEPGSFRPGWFPAFGAIDELWVADAEAAVGYRAIAPVPVQAIALPLPTMPPGTGIGAVAIPAPLVLLLSETGEAAAMRATIAIAAVSSIGDRADRPLLVVAANPPDRAVSAAIATALATAGNASVMTATLSEAVATDIAGRGRLLLALDDGADSLLAGIAFASRGRPVLALAGSPLVRRLGASVQAVQALHEWFPLQGAPVPHGQRRAVPDRSSLEAALVRALAMSDQGPGGPDREVAPAFPLEPSSIPAIRSRLEALGLDIHPPAFMCAIGRSRLSGMPAIAGALPETLWHEVARIDSRPSFSLLLPVGHVEPDTLRRCIAAVQTQAYPFWTLSLVDDGSMTSNTRLLVEASRGTDPRIRIDAVPGGLDRAMQINHAAELTSGSHLLLLRPGDTLTPRGLLDLAAALDVARPPVLLYADAEHVDHPDLPGRIICRPDWSPEQLRVQSLTGSLLVVARGAWGRLGGLRPDYGDATGYDLTMRLLEAGEPIAHVARVVVRSLEPDPGQGRDGSRGKGRARPREVAAELRVQQAHAARVGGRVEPGDAPGSVRFRPARPAVGPVSIIVTAIGDPTGPRPRRNGVVELVRTVRRTIAVADAEVLVVHQGAAGARNGVLSLADIAALRAQGARLEPAPAPAATRGSLRNVGLSRATHALALFLDVGAVPEEGLLEALLEAAADPAVGAVGTRLVPSAERHDRPGQVRNVSAVSGACLLVRRDAARVVRGFDETPLLDLVCDVDFCLRLRAAGFRVVYTPHGSAGPAPAMPPIGHEAVQAELSMNWRDPHAHVIDTNRIVARQSDPRPQAPVTVTSLRPAQPVVAAVALPTVAHPAAIVAPSIAADALDLTEILLDLDPVAARLPVAAEPVMERIVPKPVRRTGSAWRRSV